MNARTFIVLLAFISFPAKADVTEELRKRSEAAAALATVHTGNFTPRLNAIPSRGNAHPHQGPAASRSLFITTDKELKIVAQVKGLAPGAAHGFHIHENGKCDKPSFESAGGHLNPGNHVHAAPTAGVKHLGDLGNLVANKQGVATKELVFKDVSAEEARQIIGKAVILHSEADDLSSQPSGDSGNRIACGIIKGDGPQ